METVYYFTAIFLLASIWLELKRIAKKGQETPQPCQKIVSQPNEAEIKKKVGEYRPTPYRPRKRRR